MAKIVLEDTNGGYNIASINRNFQKIMAEMNNKVMYRLNDVPFESNAWLSNMDANGKHIYNLPEPTLPSEAARLQDVRNAISGLVPANLVPFTPYLDISSTNVQGAIQEVRDDIISVSATVGSASLPDYAELRASTATNKNIYITGILVTQFGGIAGNFSRDDLDITTPDNNGTVIVRADGVRFKRTGITSMNIQWFGAIPSPSFNSAPAIQNAIAAAKAVAMTVYIPSALGIGYRIDQGLVLPDSFAGIIGDSLFFSVLNYMGGGSAITFSTTSASLGTYSGFQVQAGLTGDSIAVRRAINRNGIFWKCYGGQGHIQNVKVLGFNGYGARFEAIWDSRVEGLLVESCGGNNFFACGVANGTDTSNHCVFLRLQVEDSRDNALYFEGLNMTMIGLHSERTVGNGSYTHVFLGDITLIDGRIEATSGIKVRMGIAIGSVQNFKVFNGPTYFDWGSRIINPARVIDCEFTDVIIPVTNLRHYDFQGGSMASLTTLYSEKQTTLTGVNVTGSIVLTGTGVRVNIYDGTVTGNIIESGGGVNTVEVHDSDLAYYPTVQIVRVYNSTIANSHATPGGQKARSFDCVFNGAVTIQNNGTKWETQGCEYANGVAKGLGTPGWKFGKGDWVSGGTVDVNLLVAPTTSSATFANGEYTSRLIKTVGSPQGWFCTTAGVAPTLAFTSEGNM